jgi:hypothetical protein
VIQTCRCTDASKPVYYSLCNKCESQPKADKTVEASDAVIDAIKEASRKFANDNIKNPSEADYVLFDSAMSIGALIAQQIMLACDVAENEERDKFVEEAVSRFLDKHKG